MNFSLKKIGNNGLTMSGVFNDRYLEWGDKLTYYQFLAREELLGNCAWAKQGCTTWGLFEKNDLVASCETFSTNAFQNGQYYNGVAIASVLVPIPFRKHGHATKLLKTLVARRHTSTDFFCLFSEVGTGIYEKCGFEALNVDRMSIEVSKVQDKGKSNVKFLDFEQSISIWQSLRNKNTYPSILPELEQIDWIWARSQFYAKALNRNWSKFAGVTNGESVILFVPDFKSDFLKILSAHRGDCRDAEWIDLWNRAATFCKDLGLQSVRAWVPNGIRKEYEIIEKLLPAFFDPDLDDIPMLNYCNLPKFNYRIEYQCWV